LREQQRDITEKLHPGSFNNKSHIFLSHNNKHIIVTQQYTHHCHCQQQCRSPLIKCAYVRPLATTKISKSRNYNCFANWRPYREL